MYYNYNEHVVYSNTYVFCVLSDNYGNDQTIYYNITEYFISVHIVNREVPL